jgi:peptidase E
VTSKSPAPRIVALGGGAFEPANLALNAYILTRARRRTPSVCFIPTASGDSDSSIAKFYATFASLRCRPRHVTLFTRTPDLASILPDQDVIFVGGGNTKSMLAAWREWQVPQILRRAWQSGAVLAGVSAGAICWFRTGITDSWAGRLATLRCLGWLPGVCCPHYDGEADRRPAVHRLVTTREVRAVLALDDGVGAYFEGCRLVRVLSARPKAAAYDVRLRRGRVVETPFRVVRLRP